MKFIEQVERLERLDQLIRLKATGTPKELASRLHICESSVYGFLKLVKQLGAEIHYCNICQSYVYEKEFVLKLGYQEVE